MEGFWLGLVVGVLSTVIGGLILAGVLHLIRRYWQDNPIVRRRRKKQAADEDKRLLWAIREVSRDHTEAAVQIRKAATRAEVEDPFPALNRLQRKELIVPYRDDPEYVQITLNGLRAAPPPSLERPSRWRRWFG